MRQIMFFLISLPLLSSCSLFDKQVVVEKEPVYLAIVCPEPAKPASITTLKVRPQVIQDAIGISWVALTARDYEALSINVQESIRYIKDQQGLVGYWRKCVTDFNEQIKVLKNDG